MKIVVLTGAGVSAESGLKTFRDSDGLWEGHDVMSVASPQGFADNPAMVLDFYNQRRRQLKEAEPNAAHQAIAALEESHEVTVITQNVDNLHERAGSTNVLHLHGELIKARSTFKEDSIIDCMEDIMLGDLCPNGHQLRPHIVWFGEAVPLIETAMEVMEKTDCVLIVGTSMQVYPAAGLMQYAPAKTPIFFVDPNPSISSGGKIKVFAEKATTGVPKAIKEIMELGDSLTR